MELAEQVGVGFPLRTRTPWHQSLFIRTAMTSRVILAMVPPLRQTRLPQTKTPVMLASRLMQILLKRYRKMTVTSAPLARNRIRFRSLLAAVLRHLNATCDNKITDIPSSWWKSDSQVG